MRCAIPYSNISKKCFLCLHEKLVIITYPRQHELLNKRSEVFCKCLHENKYLLKIFRGNGKGQLNILSERKTLIDSMIVYFSLFVKPSHQKNYLPVDCVSIKLRVVNN